MKWILKFDQVLLVVYLVFHCLTASAKVLEFLMIILSVLISCYGVYGVPCASSMAKY